LPGLTADHRLFDKQIEFFEGKYPVFVWDAPGHAASRPFDLDFTLADKAHWLYQILRREGVERPVLIGQSMGGFLSQAFISEYPGFAAGFISIDSAPIAKRYTDVFSRSLLRHTELMYLMFPWQFLKVYASSCLATTLYGQRLMYSFFSDYTKREYCRLTARGFYMVSMAMEKDTYGHIDCPALLICGKKDKAGYVVRYNRQWSKNEGHKLIWLDNAGHNSNTDCPDEVNRIIEQFARDIQ
ncbi:MAG: alpha/beta hydrolase, partial [Oscillospiraceae bacterium]|nr:alpha/beta hydrolase [Oscillospiraceae bacterium]